MDNVVNFPQQTGDKQSQQLAEIAGVKERTRVIPVIERKVATGTDGEPTEVEVQSKVFVRPLPFRRWAQVFSYLTGILSKLPSGDFDLANETQLALWITSLVGNAADDIFAVASLATDRPVDFFDRIDLDDGVKIIKAVVEVNKDFFVEKVLPQLSEVVPNAKSIAGTFGRTQ
jgi:hypothetical protein